MTIPGYFRCSDNVRDAYGRYNALRRELVSFLNAADGRARRARVA